MCGLGVHPDVVENLPDLNALGDKRDQAHLPTAHRTQQREHFVDARYQHRPQVLRRCALGWDRMAQRCHPRLALARGGWIGLKRRVLHEGQRLPQPRCGPPHGSANVALRATEL